YVNYIEGGGVARANIDYQTTIDYTVTDVKKDGDNYVVTVHNQFREVYLNGKSSTLTKKQVFNLRQNGDSFLIYGVSET
ncbi:TcaA NTF2-like domain-containing protein, partial [Streptococcus suis]